jgi:hypothetical protein
METQLQRTLSDPLTAHSSTNWIANLKGRPRVHIPGSETNSLAVPHPYDVLGC